MKQQIVRWAAAGFLAAAALLPATAAGATYGNPGGGGGSNDPGSHQTSNNGSGGTLPFTGGDIVGISLLGAGLAAGGTVLVRMNRRKHAY
jgi:hypothetical protein